MWGVGCIFVEMIQGVAAFPGMKDIQDQLERIFLVLGTPNEDTWPGVHSLPHFKPERFTLYSSKNLRQAWNKLSYVNYAEDLASKLLQCSPKNRLSAQAALSHEYFSDLPPRLWELTDMSSIFTVPNVRLQPEAGESMRAFGKNNSYGKSLSNSKHWWAQHSQESTGLSCHHSGKKKKNINEVANNTKGMTDQFPSPPCGGFHLQENWSWQDPVFSAIYLKPCTHLDTLWFPRTMWRLSFAYWYMACILFSLLCLILFDFPLQCNVSVKVFMLSPAMS